MKNCAVCGSGSLKKVEQFSEYGIWECPICRYAIVDPIPSSERLTELYNSREYFETHMQYDFATISEKEISAQVDRLFRFHQNMLRGIDIPERKKLLEIGPGGGFSLAAFRMLGYMGKGIETSASATAFMREKLGLNIDNISFEAIDVADYSDGFDLIFLNHVLEHFLDPVKAMEKIANLMAPGGVVYIRVPDHDSYDRKKYAAKWPAYAYYHISNFSEASLKQLFKMNQLNCLKTEKFVSEKAPAIISKIARGPLQPILANWFSGRTVTVIGKK
jgi:SAM-dependent methyltransferase